MWLSHLDDKLAPVLVGYTDRLGEFGEEDAGKTTRRYHRSSAAGFRDIATIQRLNWTNFESLQFKEYILLDQLLIVCYYPKPELIFVDIQTSEVTRPDIIPRAPRPLYQNGQITNYFPDYPVITADHGILVRVANDRYVYWNPFTGSKTEVMERGNIVIAYGLNNYVLGEEVSDELIYTKYIWKRDGTLRNIPLEIGDFDEEIPKEIFYVSAELVVLHSRLFRWDAEKVRFMKYSIYDNYRGYILSVGRKYRENIAESKICAFTSQVEDTAFEVETKGEKFFRKVGSIDTGVIFISATRLLTKVPHGVYTLEDGKLQLIRKFKLRPNRRQESMYEIGYMQLNKYRYLPLLDVYPAVLARLIMDYV